MSRSSLLVVRVMRQKVFLKVKSYQGSFTDKTTEGLAYSLLRQRCDLRFLPQLPIKVYPGKKAL